MGCSWAQVVTNGTAAHATSPPTPLLLTANINALNANGATNSADFLVSIINDLDPCTSGCGNNPWGPWASSTSLKPAYQTWLAGNCCGAGSPPRQFWSYLDNESTAQGYNTNWPNWAVDGTAVANRAMEWLSFRFGVTGELYYATTICWTSTVCRNPPDPWVTVRYGPAWDGGFLYPGRQTGSPVGSTNVGTHSPIWLPSVRLKNIRDGYQDYEYLYLLTNKGQGSLVQNAISSWLTASTNFNNTLAPVGPFTSDLIDARTTLGAATHQLTYSSSLQPPPTLTGTLQ
jgi:hypothetical protein